MASQQVHPCIDLWDNSVVSNELWIGLTTGHVMPCSSLQYYIRNMFQRSEPVNFRLLVKKKKWFIFHSTVDVIAIKRILRSSQVKQIDRLPWHQSNIGRIFSICPFLQFSAKNTEPYCGGGALVQASPFAKWFIRNIDVTDIDNMEFCRLAYRSWIGPITWSKKTKMNIDPNIGKFYYDTLPII